MTRKKSVAETAEQRLAAMNATEAPEAPKAEQPNQPSPEPILVSAEQVQASLERFGIEPVAQTAFAIVDMVMGVLQQATPGQANPALGESSKKLVEARMWFGEALGTAKQLQEQQILLAEARAARQKAQTIPTEAV